MSFFAVFSSGTSVRGPSSFAVFQSSAMFSRTVKSYPTSEDRPIHTKLTFCKVFLFLCFPFEVFLSFVDLLADTDLPIVLVGYFEKSKIVGTASAFSLNFFF